ncbi:unnamed protein product, partial [Coregonus sp. 'balchen']
CNQAFQLYDKERHLQGEDSEKDQENRLLTVNMVQGSEAALSSFALQQQEPRPRPTQQICPPPACLRPPEPRPHYHQPAERQAGSVRGAAPPSYTTSSPDTELLQDQINQCRTQLKNSVQELRESLTTVLEEVKATMRRERHHEERASPQRLRRYRHHEERASPQCLRR